MKHEERVNTFMAFYTITYGVTLGVAFAGNIITMYLFYECLTMVTLPLVIHTMTREARKATRQYLYYMIGGTAFAFIAIVFYSLFCNDIAFVLGAICILRPSAIIWILHCWSMSLAFSDLVSKQLSFRSMDAACSLCGTDTCNSAAACSCGRKSGAFAIMRLTYYCFGTEMLHGTWAQVVVLIAALITIAYGSTLGVRETHFKRRLAYSTISNLSYILLAVATMSPLA